MSIVDLMGATRWSRADRIKETERMVAAEVPAEVERILTRRALGFLFHAVGQALPPGPERDALLSMGRPLSPAQAMEIARAAAVFARMEAEADQADHDLDLLNRVLDHEQDLVQLAEDDVEGQELLARRAAVRPAEPQDDESTTEAS